MKNENILITGGAGFIGSNISKKLITLGYKIKIIDNISTGNIDNLNDIINKVNFINGDINNIDLLNKEFKGMDYVIHHAAIPSVPRSIDNPFISNENNITGTLNVLWAAKNNKIKKVIYAASSSAYGNIKGFSKKEDMLPQPLSPYAVTKLTGEYYCKIFSHTYGLNTICLRYFNVFGPFQDPNSQYSAVIPKFIKSIINNERPVIYGDGNQKRDFTFIDNNVSANILAIESKVKNGESINIACGKSYSLLDIIKIINKRLKKNIKPIFENPRPGEVRNSLANIRMAKKLLNYKPLVNFEEGLNRTIDWFLENYKND